MSVVEAVQAEWSSLLVENRWNEAVKGSGGDPGTMKLDGFATLYRDKFLSLEPFERYLESTGQIDPALPADWRMLIEHKMYEPAFHATVIRRCWSTVRRVRVSAAASSDCQAGSPKTHSNKQPLSPREHASSALPGNALSHKLLPGP
jgi:hypothetical protein